MIGDDWTDIMFDHYRALYDVSQVDAYMAVFFFMILYIVGNLILMNLFLAILLINFNIQNEKLDYYELDDKEYEKTIKIYMKCWIWFRIKLAEMCPCLFKTPGNNNIEDNDPFELNIG